MGKRCEVCIDDEKFFCGTCFSEAHSGGVLHSFRCVEVLEPYVVSETIPCAHCEDESNPNSATKRCEVCIDDEKFFCDTCFSEAHSGGVLHSFRCVKVTAPVCCHCEDAPAAVTRVCGKCPAVGDSRDNLYCDACYDRTHRSRLRRKHVWTKYSF